MIRFAIMIVNRHEHFDEDETLGWVECIFESSNILTTTYFPKTNVLYITFKRGGTYKYLNVDNDFYSKFENAESQGKFFINEMKNNENIPYERAFQAFDSEINEAEKIIEENRKKREENENKD